MFNIIIKLREPSTGTCPNSFNFLSTFHLKGTFHLFILNLEYKLEYNSLAEREKACRWWRCNVGPIKLFRKKQWYNILGCNSKCTALNYTCAFMMFVSISRIGYALHSDTGTAMHTDACNVVKFYYLLSPQLTSLWPGLPWEKEVFFFEVSSHCRNQNLDSGHGCIDEDKTVVYHIISEPQRSTHQLSAPLELSRRQEEETWCLIWT